MDEIKKDLNDIEEDKREADESLKDEFKGDDSNKVKDDIGEDEREEGESLEDLKETLKTTLLEKAKLETRVKELETQLAEAHSLFMGEGRVSQEKQRTYQSIKEDIK